MSSVLNYCDSVARYSRHAQPVISEITATTTPIEFEELRNKFPQFQLDHADRKSGTVLHKAAADGNVPLIEHIVRQAPQLLDRGGNRNSQRPPLWLDGQLPPLWLAAAEGHVAATESLISLGANVNIVEYSSNDSLLGYILHSTPSYKTDSRYRKIIKLLIKNGAELPPPNCEVVSSGRTRFQSTKNKFKSVVEGFAQEIAKERKKTSDALYKSVFFPKVLSNMIAEYV